MNDYDILNVFDVAAYETMLVVRELTEKAKRGEENLLPRESVAYSASALNQHHETLVRYSAAYELSGEAETFRRHHDLWHYVASGQANAWASPLAAHLIGPALDAYDREVAEVIFESDLDIQSRRRIVRRHFAELVHRRYCRSLLDDAQELEVLTRALQARRPDLTIAETRKSIETDSVLEFQSQYYDAVGRRLYSITTTSSSTFVKTVHRRSYERP